MYMCPFTPLINYSAAPSALGLTGWNLRINYRTPRPAQTTRVDLAQMPALLEDRISSLWKCVRSDSPQRHDRAAEIASDIYSLCIEQITEAELGDIIIITTTTIIIII